MCLCLFLRATGVREGERGSEIATMGPGTSMGSETARVLIGSSKEAYAAGQGWPS